MKALPARLKTFWKKPLSKTSPSDEEPGWTLRHETHPLVKMALVGSAIALVVGGTLYWQRSTVKRYANDWSATRHLNEAVEALSGGQPRVAVSRANTALELKPRDLEAQRIRLRGAREIRDSRVIQFAAILFLDDLAGPAERAAALGAMNDVGDGRTFEHFYDLLSDEERDAPEIRFEWLRFRVNAGQAAEVVALLGETRPTGTDVSRESVLRLRALLALRSGDSDFEAERLALEFLRESAGRSGEVADRRREVLEMLERLLPDRFRPEAADDWIAALRSDEGGEVRRFAPTLSYTIRLAATPARRTTILDEAVAALGAHEREALVRWLERLGEPGRVVALRDPDEPIRSGIVYEVTVRALAAIGRLDEALALLEFPPADADEVWALGTKAAVLNRLGRREETGVAWRRAMQLADFDGTRNRYLQVARLAALHGEKSVAADALVAACNHPLGLMPSVESVHWLVAYLVEQDRPADLLSVSRRLLQSQRHPSLLNNALYLTMVSSEGQTLTPEMIASAEDLAAERAEVREIRATLALAYALANRPEDALATYPEAERRPEAWRELRASGRATFALVLAANQLQEPFEKILAEIDWRQLTALERRFYRNLLRPYAEVEIDPDFADAMELPDSED